ncbi:methyltransferase [Spiroplasma endosymbiont of Ammophila pubescens]|uniref:methyltransferase n=1 Tax=Spiroplasma endosymbiont of Ammophila pubescens TaxID=3066315 RepID=UPI0032B1DD2D
MGNFLPQLLRIFDDCEKIEITCIDISNEIIKNLIKNLKNLKYQKDKFIFHFVVKDFLSFSMQHYDYIIGNPPYFKTLKSQYNSINMFTNFLEHSYKKCDELLFIIPKTFLMADSYFELRKKYESYYYIKNITDNGIHAFEKVFIETISIHFTKLVTTTNINILNITYNEILPINYIYHDKVWLIYRNEWFDNFIKEIALDFFIPYRDRQISNKLLETENGKIKYELLNQKKILNSSEFVHIHNYDKYISKENLNSIAIKKFINQKEILIPNFTYNIKAGWLPENAIPNGSLVVMKPKYEINNKNIDLSFFSTENYHKYYKIIKNNSKFTINIDKCTTYYIGPKKD